MLHMSTWALGIVAEHRKKLRQALENMNIPVSEMEIEKYAISFRKPPQ